MMDQNQIRTMIKLTNELLNKIISEIESKKTKPDYYPEACMLKGYLLAMGLDNKQNDKKPEPSQRA